MRQVKRFKRRQIDWQALSRKQRKAYHRIRSCMAYWAAMGYQTLWVALTTKHASGEPATKEALASLSEHFELLRQMIENPVRGRVNRKTGKRRGARHWAFPGLEYAKVLTAEGGGVVHLVLAWRGPRLFFLPQRWLSAAWKRIHGASVVWVSALGNGKDNQRKVSEYLITQYCATQDDFVRCDVSWRRTFGFPVERVWREFGKCFSSVRKSVLYRLWSELLAGGEIAAGERAPWSLWSIRKNYSWWRAAENAARCERAKQIRLKREKGLPRLTYRAPLSRALEEAYDFVCGGGSWQEAGAAWNPLVKNP